MYLTITIFMNLLLLGISDQQFADKRQLLLFGGEQHPAMMQQQLHLLQKVSDGVKERDLTITVIKKESLLWKKYEVQAGTFTVILIGKDGTENTALIACLQLLIYLLL